MGVMQCPECKNKVSDEKAVCPQCGYDLAMHFYNAEKAKKISYRRERRKQIFRIVIPVIAVIVIVSGSIAINTFILARRMTFPSEQEMIAYLQGDWSKTYNSNKDRYAVLKFYETGDGEYIARESEDFISGKCYKNIEYHYKRGYIVLDEGKFILRSDSTIRLSDSAMILNRGKPGNESNIQRTEDVLEVVETNYEVVGATTKLNYSVINKTDKNVKGTILFELKDGSGKIVGTITDMFSFEAGTNMSKINSSMEETTTKKLEQVKSYVAYIKNWYT